MFLYSRRARRRAFTLVELLVGLSILVILLLAAVGLAVRVNQRVKVAAARAGISQLAMLLETVRDEIDYYPPDRLNGLSGQQQTVKVLTRPPADIPAPYRRRWRGPYLAAAEAIDPWGQPFFYRLVEGNIYGPVAFARATHGQPYHSGPIVVRGIPGQSVTLYIDNSQAPVTSGRVYVNGQEVVSPNMFRPNAPFIREEIDLGGAGTLTLEIVISSWRGQDNTFDLSLTSPLAPGTTYELGSYGRDGRSGGRGFDAEITWHGSGNGFE